LELNRMNDCLLDDRWLQRELCRDLEFADVEKNDYVASRPLNIECKTRRSAEEPCLNVERGERRALFGIELHAEKSKRRARGWNAGK
jgi:hypothetical protein